MKRLSFCLLLLACIFVFVVSCASSGKSKGGAYVGEDPGTIGVVNDWKNPEFKGGKTTKVVAEGYAVVDRKGEADARDRSLEDAKRKAVEQAVGSIIQGSTLVENNQLIRTQIYEKTTGYIANYRVLDSSSRGGMHYSKIEAEVGVDMIQDNLQAMGILIDRMGMPLMLILVTDKDGMINDSFNVELEKKMSERGFRFVDSRTLAGVMAREKIKYTDVLGSQSASVIDKLGVGTGAEIVIVGQANASFFTRIEGTAMKSYRSDIAIRAVNVADATTIAQSTHQTGGVGGSDRDAAAIALGKSADAVSQDLTKQITSKWQAITQSGTEYTLLIVGLSFNDIVLFEKELPKHIRGVKEVFNRGFTGDASRLTVRYIGSSRNLAVDLNDKGPAMGYKVRIGSFDDKTISMNVIK